MFLKRFGRSSVNLVQKAKFSTFSKKFPEKSRSLRALSGIAAEFESEFPEMVEKRSEYLEDLKIRLHKSWAAGFESYFSGAENLVPKEEVMFVLNSALKELKNEENIVNVTFDSSKGGKDSKETTMTVVGDTHGQYYDVLNLLQINGDPNDTNKYAFNGDFVDRGSFSFQTCFLFLAFKALMPQNVFLTRGNHETVDMNVMYGFFHEIMTKYDKDVMHKFWDVFANLPLGVTLKNKKFPDFKTLVLHGGLVSPENVTLEEINSIDRSSALDGRMAETEEESRESQIVHDILWSDPMSEKGKRENRDRGGGLLFGPDVTEEFLQANGLNLLIRSHQVRHQGWSEDHKGLCFTLFSAPNYCDMSGNKGAFMKFSGKQAFPEIFEFDAVSHPPLGPMAHLELFNQNASL